MDSKKFGALFDRREDKRPKKITLITMTVYDPELKNVYAILSREHVSRTLSNILEKDSIRQLRMSRNGKVRARDVPSSMVSWRSKEDSRIELSCLPSRRSERMTRPRK